MRRWLPDTEYAYINSPAFLHSSEWALAREDAFRHWDGRCAKCKRRERQLFPHERWNVDHVRPRASRPDLALDVRNLQVLCSTDNRLKGNRHRDYRSITHPHRWLGRLIAWWRINSKEER